MKLRILFSAFLLLYSACVTHAHELPADSVSTDFEISEDADVATAEKEDATSVDNESVAPVVRVAEAPEDPATQFRASQLAFPSLAIALGGAGVRNHLIDTSSERERRFTFDDKLQYVPIGGYVALGFIPGVKHRHNFGDRFLAGATAYVTMTAVCQVAKRTIREPRPDTGTPNSFPSGHTATAFCGAELCRLEYGNTYGAVAYAFAATTGVMRVVNNRHWCNDVLAGAGIGFLSAHVGYWLLPWEKRVLRSIFKRSKSVDTASSPFLLAPTYEYNAKAPGLTFSMIF